jgi:hypothetical protein
LSDSVRHLFTTDVSTGVASLSPQFYPYWVLLLFPNIGRNAVDYENSFSGLLCEYSG